MSNAYRFSLDTFKKWMKEHSEEDQHNLRRPARGNDLIGLFVEPKVSVRKMVTKMTSESEELEKLATEFENVGGKIVEINDKDFVIEVDSGRFSIHRYYVKRPGLAEA